MSPLLNTEYELTQNQIAAYRRDGFVLLPGVAGAEEIATFRPLLQRIVQERFEERDASGEQRRPGRYFGQVANVWQRDAALQPFIFAKRFAQIAARLMGVQGVRLYHDQALFKPAGGRGTPWHQDQFYWPLDTTRTITLWMPLIDLPREWGTMKFAAGSHKTGPLLELSISDQSDQEFDTLLSRNKHRIVDFGMKAGDATMHSGWTVHAAHANSGPHMREVITIIYYADGTRILEPDSAYRKADLEAFHPGQHPGDIAASPLNPLLYP